MYSGISGMKNAQTKLDVIGNNIANVNTYGFKKGRTTFKDLVSQQISGASSSQPNRGGTNPIQVGLGSTLSSIDVLHTQGSMQSTGRALDLGISGDGFFIVNNGNSPYYTRAGNFYLDETGKLVTADGNLVQGYGVNANGTLENSLSSITIDSSSFMSPEATSLVELKGNLDAGLENGETSRLHYTVKDSLGNDHELELLFTKTGANQWDYDISSLSNSGSVNSGIAGSLDFNSDGTLNTPNLLSFTLDPTTGAALGQQLTLDINDITQVSSASTVAVDTMDGHAEGYLESFNISPAGEVIGVYTNGEINLLSQLAIATFSNNGGLTKAGNNLYQASNNSGIPNIGLAGDGRGVLAAGALEMSNVDLSEEFTEMITAQRSFQANTRIITTSDEILQELVNLKR